MAYIYTESSVEIISYYANLYTLFDQISINLGAHVINLLNLVIKNLIGYCHFFYQLNYGMVVYIYIYRRYSAKKNKNWSTFYGNSISNWLLSNVVVFNKFLFNRVFIIYLKTKLVKTTKLSAFLIKNNLLNSVFFVSLTIFVARVKSAFYVIWTPLFKKSSYISFLTFLKRFSKRK